MQTLTDWKCDNESPIPRTCALIRMCVSARGNTRKVLLTNLIKLLLSKRPGAVGYISHNEIRRWHRASHIGLLGVIYNPEPEDLERQMRAIGLVQPVGEEGHDAHSSTDDDLLTESDMNEIPEDAGDAARMGGKRPRGPGRGPDGGAAGGAAAMV